MDTILFGLAVGTGITVPLAIGVLLFAWRKRDDARIAFVLDAIVYLGAVVLVYWIFQCLTRPEIIGDILLPGLRIGVGVMPLIGFFIWVFTTPTEEPRRAPARHRRPHSRH